MLDGELAHRKIPRVAGREPTAERERCGRDEAVCLGERTAASRELAAPFAGLPALRHTERNGSQPLEERTSRSMLARLESPYRLLDVDRTHVGRVVRIAERLQTPSRIGTTAEEVDDDSRVEKYSGQLADTALMGAPLFANPSAGVFIPVVTTVSKRAQRRFDQLPAMIVVERSFDRIGNVGAAAPSPHTPIKLPHEIVSESYVQTHGHNLTHYGSVTAMGPGRSTLPFEGSAEVTRAGATVVVAVGTVWAGCLEPADAGQVGAGQ